MILTSTLDLFTKALFSYDMFPLLPETTIKNVFILS